MSVCYSMEMNYSCSECKYATSKRSILQRHVYQHIPPARWPLMCPVEACSFFCKYPSEYEQHRKSEGHKQQYKDDDTGVDDSEACHNEAYRALECQAMIESTMQKKPALKMAGVGEGLLKEHQRKTSKAKVAKPCPGNKASKEAPSRKRPSSATADQASKKLIMSPSLPVVSLARLAASPSASLPCVSEPLSSPDLHPFMTIAAPSSVSANCTTSTFNQAPRLSTIISAINGTPVKDEIAIAVSNIPPQSPFSISAQPPPVQRILGISTPTVHSVKSVPAPTSSSSIPYIPPPGPSALKSPPKYVPTTRQATPVTVLQDLEVRGELRKVRGDVQHHLKELVSSQTDVTRQLREMQRLQRRSLPCLRLQLAGLIDQFMLTVSPLHDHSDVAGYSASCQKCRQTEACLMRAIDVTDHRLCELSYRDGSQQRSDSAANWFME